MSTLVECVPNFSEGCDKWRVDAIVEAMKMPGVYLLDRESDSDHNRSVITLVGEREAIQEAAGKPKRKWENACSRGLDA
jgi:glutamate formiminotransferase